MKSRPRRQIGLCPDCATDLDLRDRDGDLAEVVCPDCGWWSISGTGHKELDGHPPSSSGEQASLIAVLVAGLVFGGACIGAATTALLSPVAAVLLVALPCAVVVGVATLGGEPA
jgi:hypothetical protein